MCAAAVCGKACIVEEQQSGQLNRRFALSSHLGRDID
jgi:hypothetical protein